MSINSKLRKEGIEILEQLNTLKVNTVATNIASKLCLAFPEHNLNRSQLFADLCRLNMYVAKMPMDFTGAKYFYKNNSIYFNENISLDEMSDLAVHECIHYIQELRDSNNNLTKMGLYNFSFNYGLGINEAAVQLMASEANMSKFTSETYFGVLLKTNSPDYYPLECSLVNQMAYFTGTYPLYHSTLYSNDIFKKTFILKSDKKTYSTIVRNLDKLLALETDLNYFSSELQYADKVNTIKLLNKLIVSKKSSIKDLYYRTQNLIIEKCFTAEFNDIRNLDDIKSFTKKLYNYKNVMGSSDDYSFYNKFYCKMMELIESKKEYIKQFGEISLFEINDTTANSLVVLNNSKNAFDFVNILFSKIRKLFNPNRGISKNINL